MQIGREGSSISLSGGNIVQYDWPVKRRAVAARPVRVECQNNCTVEVRQTYRGLPRTESPAVLQPAA